MRAFALFCEIGQPVERTLHVGSAETRAFQIANQRLTLGARRQLFEHVAIENINQNVENRVVHR